MVQVAINLIAKTKKSCDNLNLQKSNDSFNCQLRFPSNCCKVSRLSIKEK